MKFSEMPYERPDIALISKEYDGIIEEFENAMSADEQINAFYRHEKLLSRFSTMQTIAEIRHTVNTKDEFYSKESEYFDENAPLLREKTHALTGKLLESKFRSELEAKFGEIIFINAEIEKKTFKPEIIPLSQEENSLVSSYQNLYGSAMVEFNGEKLPLPKLGPYKMSTDRAVRKAAFEAEGKFFDEHQTEFDELYDKLVKNRTAQAKLLGYENYVQLGYDLLGRNCYTPADVAEFRKQISEHIVPVVSEIRNIQAKRIGIPDMKLYDQTLIFPDGNATPVGTSEDILAAGRKMYRELSKETAEFVDFLYDNELFDVLSKDGKAPGGYCTDLNDYKATFIFSNFNGTSGDVDVLTHEAGHAFAGYRAMRSCDLIELYNPTSEACEVHSMSMEFLTSDFHNLFFGKDTDKYKLYHCESATDFLPYGTMVDEFQTRMYECPDMTPEQRNEYWLTLEKKYRPGLDFDGLPFYSRGAGWQRQLHIYMYPFYYIDYCMAQTVAFEIWFEYLKDKESAWNRYMKFVDMAGRKTFEQLVLSSGLRLPYSDGCMEELGKELLAWIKEHQI